MRHRFELPITVITGPATDNEVGQHYIQSWLGLPAHNARRDAVGLLKVVRKAIDEWVRSRESGVRDVMVGVSDSPLQDFVFPTPDSRLLTPDYR
jgi:hypothetical protein